MADVARDRAQLFLVTALSMAVLFVALALLLNTAIYTENLATRSTDVSAAEALEFREEVVGAAGGLVESANDLENDTEGDLGDAFASGTATGTELFARYQAVRGASASVTNETVAFGALAEQVDRDRNFTDRSGSQNWTAAAGVTEVRDFRLNVTRSELSDPSGLGVGLLSDSVFRIHVEGTTSWRVFVYEDGGRVRVDVKNGTDPVGGTCSGPSGSAGEHVVVDLTRGTVAGEDCALLDYARGVSGSYDVEFVNAADAAGTWSFLANTSEPSFLSNLPADTDYAEPTVGSPFTTPALYSANVSLVYRSVDVAYETEVRVAPGEHDD